MFEITEEDNLNIKLAETVGVTHLAVSYPQVKHSIQLFNFIFILIKEVISSIKGDNKNNKNIPCGS